MSHPFQRNRNADPKLTIIRRADAHRDASYTVGGKRKLPKKPISLAPVPTIEKANDGAPCHPKGETNG